jgi:hypothetical protein
MPGLCSGIFLSGILHVVNAKLPKVNLGSNNRRVTVRNNAIRINFADRINQSFVFDPHDSAGVGSLVGQV